MTVEEWNPDSKGLLNMALLKSFAEVDISGSFEKELTGEAIKTGARLSRLEEKDWKLIEPLDIETLYNLIRFFTLAESRLPGWQSGKRSPVIHLVKELRKRDAFSEDLRKWIKKNSRNRFLPYGAVLIST